MAGEILPNLYAREYCSFRRMGVSKDEAMEAAVAQSYVSTGNPPRVTINGVQYDSDVVRAIRTASQVCPGL